MQHHCVVKRVLAWLIDFDTQAFSPASMIAITTVVDCFSDCCHMFLTASTRLNVIKHLDATLI